MTTALKTFLRAVAKSLSVSGDPVGLDVSEILDALCDTQPQSGKASQPPQVLQTSLEATNCLACAKPITDFAHHLTWIAAREIPDLSNDFVGDFHFCRIAGEGGLFEIENFRCGLYIQMPNSYYPPHKHAAVELYLPLSGTAHWQVDEDPFQPVAPGTLIHHATYQPHATTTYAEPLLAFWSWTGDTRFETYSFVNR